MALERFLLEIEKLASDKKIKTSLFLMHKINFARARHIRAKPHEERQSAEFLSRIKIAPLSVLRNQIIEMARSHKKESKEAESRLAHIISQKIQNGSVIFAQGNSKTIINGLKKAKDEGIRFTVLTSDSGPSLEGRRAAASIAKFGIPVAHFPDILLHNALMKADIVFFEPEALSAESKIMVKSGVNDILYDASKRNAACYCVIDSRNIKQGFGRIHQIDKKQGNITFMGQRLEEVKKQDITAVISEKGILR